MKSYIVSEDTIKEVISKFSDVEKLDEIINYLISKRLPLDIGEVNYEIRNRYVGGSKTNNIFLNAYHELHNKKY